MPSTDPTSKPRSIFPTALRTAAACLGLAVALGAADAQAPARPLVIAAQNLSARAQRDSGSLRAGDAVIAGDTVEYALTFTNDRPAAVHGVRIEDAIPAGLVYVVSSARVDRSTARVEFSIDGGREWSASPVLTEVVDGVAQTRPAPAERYTHIRWLLDGAVAPNASVVARFRARMPVTRRSQAGR